MNRHLANLVQLCFLFLDLLVLNAVYLCCEYLLAADPDGRLLAYTYLWVYCNTVWLLLSWLNNTYRSAYIFSFELFTRCTLKAYLFFCGLAAFYLFLQQETSISRLFFVCMVACFGLGLLLNRFFHLFLYHYYRNKPYITRKVLIIGYNQRSKKLMSYLEQQPVNTHIIGFYEEEKNMRELTPYPVFTSRNNIIQVSVQEQVTEIYSTVTPEEDHSIYKLINEADQACIRFRIIPNLDQFIRRPVRVDYIENMPVLSLRNEPLEDIGNRIKKRVFDILVSSLVIVLLLSWLVPVLAILIRLGSRGPVFFIQKRNGKDGKPFRCLKFRSMTVNKDSHLKQATKNDSRITRLGAFMRKTSIDELPQFFNVLKGNMSVVGPRPHMLKHTRDYSRLINQFMIRHFVKPGITGWAQVNGYRGETKTTEDMSNRVKYDIWYLENWSLLLDMRIVFMTALNIVKGEKNAY